MESIMAQFNSHGRLLSHIGILVLCALPGLSQSSQWKLEGSKAVAERKFVLPSKSEIEIYNKVYRWLMTEYKNPEDVIKARLEGEYLRGVGYASECVKVGALSSGDLQYTFAFAIRKEEVTVTLSNAILLYSYASHDGYVPVEHYMNSDGGQTGKSNPEFENVRTSMDAFSSRLFASLQSQLIKN
jgi:hypothetical protein